MAWFKRNNKGIQTPTDEKKDIPKGLWYKSPTGKIVDTEELQKNFYVSPEDDYHVRIGSAEYFSILFDNKFKEKIIFVKIKIVLFVNWWGIHVKSKTCRPQIRFQIYGGGQRYFLSQQF